MVPIYIKIQNSEIKVRILRKKSEFWEKSQNSEIEVKILRKKSEFWEKSQNCEIEVRILTFSPYYAEIK